MGWGAVLREIKTGNKVVLFSRVPMLKLLFSRCSTFFPAVECQLIMCEARSYIIIRNTSILIGRYLNDACN